MQMLFAAFVLPGLALGNHMVGPMQERLDECERQECPGSYEYFQTMVTDGNLDIKRWLTEKEYILGEASQTYPDVLGYLSCVCEKCPALTEAIWQPVGREMCAHFGFTLPCQDELEACLAAGNTNEECYPGNSIMGYKAGYDLSNPEECQALCRNEDGENAPPCNGDDPLISFVECIATSRVHSEYPYIADLAVPCDRDDPANEKKICEGVPAPKCEALPDCGWGGVPCCHYQGTSTRCSPSQRRLLFGTNEAPCVCE